MLEQQQALLQLLDKALASKLRSKISDDTPIFPEQDHANAQARFKGGSVMEVLEKIFRESNPVFRRRCELIHLKPNKGEKFSSYMSRLIEMSEECDLHELTHEDFILLVATMHCNKDELRREIKRVSQPTWIEIESMVEDYERSMIGEESQKANQVQKAKRKPQAQQDQKQGIPKELQGKCFKCAKDGHKAGECRLSPDTKCTSCGRLGHIAKACISSRMNKKQNSPPARTAKEVKIGKPDASDADDENEDTEKAKVVVVHRTMKRGDSPDTLL